MRKRYFRNKKLTKEDLKKNNRLYDKNLEMLQKAIGTPKHRIYATKEKELSTKDKEIREYLRRNEIR